MEKQKSPFDLTQRKVQKIYRENLTRPTNKQKESRDTLIFLGFIVFGFIIWGFVERIFF